MNHKGDPYDFFPSGPNMRYDIKISGPDARYIGGQSPPSCTYACAVLDPSRVLDSGTLGSQRSHVS